MIEKMLYTLQSLPKLPSDVLSATVKLKAPDPGLIIMTEKGIKSVQGYLCAECHEPIIFQKKSGACNCSGCQAAYCHMTCYSAYYDERMKQRQLIGGMAYWCPDCRDID